MTRIFVLYFLGINILTFFVYAIDKSKAKRKLWRIPEWQLISFALLGGSLGAWSAMYLFRHKTKHSLFAIGIPTILLLQIVTGVYLLIL